MVATATIDELLGTQYILGGIIREFYRDRAEDEVIRQWNSEPALRDTSNSQVIDSHTETFGEIEVKTNGGNAATYANVPSSTKERSFYDVLQQKIFGKLVFPKHWSEENVNRPNVTAKNNALRLCWEIYKKYDLQPDRILPTKEEGVYIVYDNVDNRENRSLVLEAYNDAEIGAVVCDNDTKEILHNEDIIDVNVGNVVRIYRERTR